MHDGLSQQLNIQLGLSHGHFVDEISFSHMPIEQATERPFQAHIKTFSYIAFQIAFELQSERL